jgi:hypothetical protein
MKSIPSITERSRQDVDLNTLCHENSQERKVYFNVHKVYEELASYKFESTIEIKCGNAYFLKVRQIGETIYTLNKSLVVEELNDIVKNLFNDTLLTLKKHREGFDTNSKRKSTHPDIIISPNVISDYYSNDNYKDLLKSCSF